MVESTESIDVFTVEIEKLGEELISMLIIIIYLRFFLSFLFVCFYVYYFYFLYFIIFFIIFFSFSFICLFLHFYIFLKYVSISHCRQSLSARATSSTGVCTCLCRAGSWGASSRRRGSESAVGGAAESRSRLVEKREKR